MTPNRRLLAGIAVGFAVLLLAALYAFNRQPPLSPLEQQLVGTWSDQSTSDEYLYRSDRTFLTSDGQFRGVWKTDRGKLTVTYQTTWDIPNFLSIGSIEGSIREFRHSRNTYAITRVIEFVDDGRRVTLDHPVDELHPDGKWIWTRIGHR